MGKVLLNVQLLHHRLHKRTELRHFVYVVLDQKSFRQYTLEMLGCIVNGQHRQVVALLSITNKLMYLTSDGFDQLSGLNRAVGTKHLFDSFQAKLLAPGVLRLCQSVGIEEQCRVWLQLRFLHTILYVLEHPDRQMRHTIHRSHSSFSPFSFSPSLLKNNRRVVTGIAVAQTPRRQIEHTDKHGHENIRLIALT